MVPSVVTHVSLDLERPLARVALWALALEPLRKPERQPAGALVPTFVIHRERLERFSALPEVNRQDNFLLRDPTARCAPPQHTGHVPYTTVQPLIGFLCSSEQTHCH